MVGVKKFLSVGVPRASRVAVAILLLGLLGLVLAGLALGPDLGEFVMSGVPNTPPITDVSPLDCLLRHARCVH